MKKYFDFITNKQGDAIAGAMVEVFNSNGTYATIYSDNGITVQANPMTTDASGYFAFYVADGRYNITTSGVKITTKTITDVLIVDPLGSLGLSTGASLVGFKQAGTGAVSRTVQSKNEETVSVKDFGAVGDGVTDDTAAIQAAANYCATFPAYDVGRGSPTLIFPECGGQGYLVTSAIVIKSGIPVEMRNCSLLYAGVANITVLTIGEKAQRTFRGRLVGLDVRRTGNITRNNTADIGICLINQFFCEIEIRSARDFYIGARCQGVNPGEGFYYNRVSLGYFFGNAINLDLFGGDGTDGGWVNENLFLGGECQGGSADSYNRYGVRVWNSPLSTIFNDNNLFIKPSFEMNGAVGNESIPFLIQNSDGLRVINGRHEGANSTVFARILNDSHNTDIHVGHHRINESHIDDQSLHKSTTVQNQKVNWQFAGKLIYETGSLGRTICRYNTTRWHIPGLNFYRQVDPTLLNASGPVASFSGDKVTLSGTDAVARMIRTERCKKFSVNVDADAGEYPWFVVQCFDAAGAILDSAGGGHPYVAGPALTYATAWRGYAYIGGVESERLFTVTDAVKSVRIGLYAGSMRGFSVYALGIDNQFAVSYSGYEDVVPNANIAIQTPVDGTWAVGRVIYNAAPTASGFIGWVCTTAGTPGTWKTFGAISA